MTNSTSRLADLRKAAGLSQQDVAERAGCSISTARLVEWGVRCSPAMAQRIAAVFDVEPAELWGGE